MAGLVDLERIFLSAVSSEFGTARRALASALRIPGRDVREQSDFGADPHGETLLDKLHNYIKDCTVVICLIGERSGGKPRPAEALAYQNMLPAGIDRNTCTEWSYTQWEVFFTLHYRAVGGTPGIITIQAENYTPEEPGTPDDRQTNFVEYLKNYRGTDLSTKAHDARQFQIEAQNGLAQIRRGGASGNGDDGSEPKPIDPDIHSIGELFTGRDAFLDRLRASLLRQNGGVSAIRALHGMGGIGKTRAAMEYALRHQDEYTALLFIRAYDQATLDRELAALTGLLRLPERDATDDTVRKDAVLRWLSSHPGWLLILDNVDTPEALRAATALARSLRSGHILLTSRLEGSFAQDIETLELGLLTPGDAVAYLLKATEGRRRGEPGAPAQAAKLAGALDHLTLALVHAAAYIAERRFTFARYMTEWQSNRARVLDWAAPDVTGYPMSLAQTWITSMDQLTPAGRALLERLSFFANDPVPEFLLDVPLPDSETAEGLEPLLDLQRFSLITRDAEAERFTVHRIVRDVTNRRLSTDPAAQRTRLIEALGWINTAFVGDAQDPGNWSRLDKLAPHAEEVALHGDDASIADPTIRLMGHLDVLFDAKAQYPRAELMSRAALALVERTFGKQHPSVATRLNNLATLLQATNRPAEAEPLMRRALAIDEASLGPDHPNVARDLNNLAQLLKATNRPAEAEPLRRRALDIGEASLGPNHPEVAIRLNNLAMLLHDTNRLAEAEPFMRRALAIGEASLGPDHPSVATRLNNLAQLLKATNRPAEAEPLMRRALAIDEASLGPDHPNVARDLNNLAQLLKATNRPAEAEPLMRRALAIDQASFGPDHPDVAIDLNNLGMLLQDTNRLAEAEPLMRRMAVIFLTFERSTGHNHPDADTGVRNYENLLSELGRDAPAIRAAIDDARREAGLR